MAHCSGAEGRDRHESFDYVIRKILARPSTPRWSQHRAMFDRAVAVVQFFYIASAYLLYDAAREFTHLSGSLADYDLLWPVRWVTDVRTGGDAIALLGLTAGLLGVFAWRNVAVRILVSLAFLQYAAFSNSEGAINHGWHEVFWVSVCFWFLPTTNALTRTERIEFLTSFALAPALILTFYAMSGLYKTYYAILAVVGGTVGGFAPDAMAITLAWRAIQTGAEPLLAAPIINQPLLGWPLFLGLYYCEVASLFVIFRPRLHMIWGVVLIAFHFGTLAFMDITFGPHVLLKWATFRHVSIRPEN